MRLYLKKKLKKYFLNIFLQKKLYIFLLKYEVIESKGLVFHLLSCLFNYMVKILKIEKKFTITIFFSGLVNIFIEYVKRICQLCKKSGEF